MFDNEARIEIERIAKSLKIEPAALLAVAEIESAGKAFAVVNGKAEPLIRWECHYFDRLVRKDAKALARKAGLANPTAGAVKNPVKQQDRYAMLEKAMGIDRDAAIQSCSWGLGQVMGSHWRSLGFGSPTDFMATARSGLAGQVMIMAKFIEANKNLATALAHHRWAEFARGYNGPSYRRNKYDQKMADAYAKWVKAPAAVAPPPLKPKPEVNPVTPSPVQPKTNPAVGSAGIFIIIATVIGSALTALWGTISNLPCNVLGLFCGN